MRDGFIPRPSRHKATGQAVVRLCGKDHYLGHYGSAEANAAYERLIAEWLANGRTLPGSAPSGPTVNEVVLAYVRHAEGHYTSTSKRCSEVGNVKDACKVLRSLYGRTPAAEFGPKALKIVRSKMAEKGWCRTHLNAQVNRLKRMFKWAVAEELVPPAVYQAVQTLPPVRRGEPGVREGKPVRPVPDAYVDAALPYMSPPVRVMVELQRLTGARPGEVCVMRGCDLDVGGKVWVYRPGSDRGPEGKHKTAHHGHRREIYIGPKAQAVLKPWLRADLSAYLFSPAESEAARHAERGRNRRTPVTPSEARRKPRPKPKRPHRDHYSPFSYHHAVTNACDKADDAARKKLAGAGTPVADDARLVPRWHPHQLRHNAATALRKEHGIDLTRIVLGHSTAFTTEIYAEADRKSAMDVIGKVG